MLASRAIAIRTTKIVRVTCIGGAFTTADGIVTAAIVGAEIVFVMVATTRTDIDTSIGMII